MEVLRLPLSASQKGKLISAGYTSIASLSSVSPSHLALDLKVSETEALEILKCVSEGSRLQSTSSSLTIVNGAQSAWDMLQEEETCVHITTSCADLDNILGGGISCKEVTEIGGVPGIEFNLQLMFRYHMITVELEARQFISIQKGPKACEVKMMQPKDFLENISYFRVCSYTEQIALTNYLDKFITEHKDVKVVIIDSITFHFRQDFDDMALRTRVLGGMALNLMKLARKFGVAVVVLNQVTTKFSDGAFHLALALGDSWSHSSTNRIILHWNGNERYAYIDKSPSLRSASAPYSVTPKGIRNSNSNKKRIKHI
ncbi:hypothetical protein M8C21_019740 [Ambrosia artemisiifolia]|uniref:DNA repair protein RAD51 homolog 3 n=1 Tax=Ambrosia artemisiifolia TaxID=4212 RepID=A0AAD5GIY4_AMBAR|nr:hypothetical protein M8C21_019740 [Ambrosia artemisiifolia]